MTSYPLVDSTTRRCCGGVGRHTQDCMPIRDRDEREGRLLRELRERCADLGLDLIQHQQALVGAIGIRVVVVNQRTGSRITEYNRDAAEALDRVLDRLNRREWDL